MIIIYPCDMLDPRQPDAQFIAEVAAFKQADFRIGLIDLEALENGATRIKQADVQNQRVLYRGWMVTPAIYAQLEASVTQQGGTMITSLEAYQQSHYLPNWYPLIRNFTPETAIFPLDEHLINNITALNWNGYFIKDYVKSLKTELGSKITRPDDVAAVIEAMQHYRGTIEGGVCVRQIEEINPESERRYFVIHGRAYGADPEQALPSSVEQIAQRINSPFFSVDVVMRRDGAERIIEIGDGQVSDLVGWTAARFVEIWQTI